MIKSIYNKIDQILFGKFDEKCFYIQYIEELEKEIVGSCTTLLDVGCGPNSPIREFSHKLDYTVGIDIFPSAIEKSRSAGIHDDYKPMNALEIGNEFKENEFDCVLASDLIEHLIKKDGLKLIKKMEAIAKKKVIIFTPNGFLPQSKYNGNKYQKHLSGWHVTEMRKLGYRIRGISGWKALKGECGNIVWHPSLFWARVSILTQLITKRYPQYAFEILCVKDL